ncbi:acyltransferase [Eubacterium oxidoreducens]|uniref:Surface polysaccharide O-acyltransferase, integral membrane enzyme n=1 Tax=Eubacterium oxidoreducens TaxID=1732 RepID=A0A1G6CNY3_EUBOX|nr:acyltransferase [Eubacterium oxidoreducens]SDB34586.1 Surface polysaccharide O-acyltransferase, integral membrane enzyme [Eubacterium oxidoreducens]
MEGKSSHFNAIDVTKFICAILVVMIHVKMFGEGQSEFVIGGNYFFKQYIARIAVPFFFTASGFLLFQKMSVANFSMQRPIRYVLRILRLYLVWTIIYFPLKLTFIYNDPIGPKKAWILWGKNLAFSGSYTHLWYLPALIVAVLLVAFLLWIKVKPMVILVISTVLYLIGLLGQSWFGVLKSVEQVAPELCHIAYRALEIIITTRNGVFDGFFFVALGMCFAFCKVHIGKWISLAGFIGSMIVLYFEVYGLEEHRMIKEHDMYLFLMPACMFLFSFVLQVQLKDRKGYSMVRSMSYLLFYMHPLVNELLFRSFIRNHIEFNNGLWRYVLVVVLTLIISMVIIKLSKLKGLKWLKVIYT